MIEYLANLIFMFALGGITAMALVWTLTLIFGDDDDDS